MSVLLAGVFSALIVPRVVHRYQVNGKVMEFRFQVYREAAFTYVDLVAAAWSLIAPRRVMEAWRRAPPTQPGVVERVQADLERRIEVFDRAEIAAMRLLAIMPTLYSKPVQESWASALDHLSRVRSEEGFAQSRKALDDAAAAEAQFRTRAATEIPLRYTIGRLVDPEEAKRTRDMVDEILSLRWLDPRGNTGNDPGGERR